MTENITSISLDGYQGSSPDALHVYVDADISCLVAKDKPVVIAFPYEEHSANCKSRQVVLSLAGNDTFAQRFSFGEISADKDQKLAELFYVLVVPAIVIVYKGKVVSILSGEEIDLQSALNDCEMVLSVLDSADDSEEALNNLETQARKKIIKAGKRLSRGSWEMVPMSGLVAGVVMAISKFHLDGLTWLLPTGIAYVICISNGNFRFNITQKIVASGIMYVIGMYWPQLLEFFMGPK